MAACQLTGRRSVSDFLPFYASFNGSLPSSPANRNWLFRVSVIALGFPGGGNVTRAGPFENLLRELRPFRIVRVDGDEDSSVLYQPFIALGLIFGDSHADQRARQSTQRAADSDAAQRGHNRASRNEGPKPRNSQKAHSEQPAQCASDDRAGCGSSSCSLGSLCALHKREVLCPHILREQHRNIRFAEPGRLHFRQGAFRAVRVRINAKNCSISHLYCSPFGCKSVSSFRLLVRPSH